jgi:hypothetical protein
VAYENSRLRSCQAQNRFVIETVRSGCLSRLKIDARFAPENGCSMLRQILRRDLVPGALKAGV